MAERSTISLTVVLTALFLTLFLAALDFSVATTAVPTISYEFQSSVVYIWIGSAYLLSSGAAAPVWAKFSDVWGRRFILAAIVIFFAGSALCASATSIARLIAGRAIQGSAAGGLIVLVNICISDLFSMRHRGLYLSLTGLVWGFASGIGPLLGGLFTQRLSWRWNWWINLPISFFSFIVLALSLDVHNPRTDFLIGIRAMDWLGSIAIVGLTILVLLGLDLGGVVSPWGSPKIISRNNPLMPFKLLRSRSNIATLIVCFTHDFVNVASWYFLPLYFQSVHGTTPVHSGLYILPVVLVQSCTGILAGFFLNRIGRYRELIWTGMGLTTLGFGLFISLSATTSLVQITAMEVVAGLGVGLVFQPLLIALQACVELDDVAVATAVFGFVRSLATSVSVVVGGVVFQNGMQARAATPLLLLPAALPPALAQKFEGQNAAANVVLISTLNPHQKEVVEVAYAESLRNMWVMYACAAALGLVASTFIAERKLGETHVEVKTGVKAALEEGVEWRGMNVEVEPAAPQLRDGAPNRAEYHKH